MASPNVPALDWKAIGDALTLIKTTRRAIQNLETHLRLDCVAAVDAGASLEDTATAAGLTRERIRQWVAKAQRG